MDRIMRIGWIRYLSFERPKSYYTGNDHEDEGHPISVPFGRKQPTDWQ